MHLLSFVDVGQGRDHSYTKRPAWKRPPIVPRVLEVSPAVANRTGRANGGDGARSLPLAMLPPYLGSGTARCGVQVPRRAPRRSAAPALVGPQSAPPPPPPSSPTASPSSCTTAKVELLGLSRWRRPQSFELNLDGAKRSEAHAVGSAASNHEAITIAVEAIDLHHAFERIDEPNV